MFGTHSDEEEMYLIRGITTKIFVYCKIKGSTLFTILAIFFTENISMEKWAIYN